MPRHQFQRRRLLLNLCPTGACSVHIYELIGHFAIGRVIKGHGRHDNSIGQMHGEEPRLFVFKGIPQEEA